MKTLSRQELVEEYNAIIAKYGEPTNGNIYCKEQLIAEVAHCLCAFGETNIVFENGRFEVSPSVCIKAQYATDHTFLGTVKQNEWYTPEQIKTMHEIAFGYQF